jgi:hypothetical protein
LTRLYSTRNVISLITQSDEHDTIAVKTQVEEQHNESVTQVESSEHEAGRRAAKPTTTKEPNPVTLLEPSEEDTDIRASESMKSSECNAATQVEASE